MPAVHGVCSGQRYEIGCGTADGRRVMNVSQVVVNMNSEPNAARCSKLGICTVVLTQGKQQARNYVYTYCCYENKLVTKKVIPTETLLGIFRVPLTLKRNKHRCYNLSLVYYR